MIIGDDNRVSHTLRFTDAEEGGTDQLVLANGATDALDVDMPSMLGAHPLLVLTAPVRPDQRALWPALQYLITETEQELGRELLADELRRLRTTTRRRYNLRIDSAEWDYTPLGRDVDSPEDCDSVATCWRPVLQPYAARTRYERARVQRCTDASCSRIVERGAEDAYLGTLAPTLRMRDDELLVVVVYNSLAVDVEFGVHGLERLAGEGSDELGASLGANATRIVGANSRRTFVYRLPPTYGGTHETRSTNALVYDFAGDTLQLYGALIVTASGFERSADDLHPADVENEFVLHAATVDENLFCRRSPSPQLAPSTRRTVSRRSTASLAATSAR